MDPQTLIYINVKTLPIGLTQALETSSYNVGSGTGIPGFHSAVGRVADTGDADAE